MTAREKVQRAERATSRVYSDGAEAILLVGKRRSNNGYGILHDPRSVYADLIGARKAVTAAIDELTAALKVWPTELDYDEVECENNRIDDEELEP